MATGWFREEKIMVDLGVTQRGFSERQIRAPTRFKGRHYNTCKRKSGAWLNDSVAAPLGCNHAIVLINRKT